MVTNDVVRLHVHILERLKEVFAKMLCCQEVYVLPTIHNISQVYYFLDALLLKHRKENVGIEVAHVVIELGVIISDTIVRIGDEGYFCHISSMSKVREASLPRAQHCVRLGRRSLSHHPQE